jgi:hypothetical protein
MAVAVAAARLLAGPALSAMALSSEQFAALQHAVANAPVQVKTAFFEALRDLWAEPLSPLPDDIAVCFLCWVSLPCNTLNVVWASGGTARGGSSSGGTRDCRQ